MKKFLLLSLIITLFFTGCRKELVIDRVIPVSGISGTLTKSNNKLKVKYYSQNSMLTTVLYPTENGKSKSNYTFGTSIAFVHYQDYQDSSSGKKADEKSNSDSEDIKYPYQISMSKTFYSLNRGYIPITILLALASQGKNTGVIPNPELIQDILFIVNNNDSNYTAGNLTGRIGDGRIAKSLVKSQNLEMILKLENTGENSIKEPFHIVDTYPSFLKVKNVEFSSNYLESISFDKRELDGNRTLLVFEAIPNKEDGFEPDDEVFIKVTVKSDFNKLLEYIKELKQ